MKTIFLHDGAIVRVVYTGDGRRTSERSPQQGAVIAGDAVCTLSHPRQPAVRPTVAAGSVRRWPPWRVHMHERHRKRLLPRFLHRGVPRT